MERNLLKALGAAVLLSCSFSSAGAQQTTIGVPYSTAGSSFYEQFGVQWGIRGRGWFFNFGGPAPVPFGGFDPAAGANFGFAGPGGFLNFSAAQGANSFLGSQTPMVTMPNGGMAVFNDQQLRPFVTGIIPIVGGEPPVFSSVLEERLYRLQAEESVPASSAAAPTAGGVTTPRAPSTAEHGDVSVAEIKARRAAEKSGAESASGGEVAALLEKARGALAAGKPAVARIYLQMAARRTDGKRRAAILVELERVK